MRRHIGDAIRALANIVDPPRLSHVYVTAPIKLYMGSRLVADQTTHLRRDKP
jgi:hypothetical protein